MLGLDDSTTWIAVGTSALAALLLLALVLTFLRRRPLDDSLAMYELTHAVERAQQDAARAHEEARQARESSDRAEDELRWLRGLSTIGATVDLEGVLQRALEAAAHLANAAASMIMLARDGDEPLVATFGLSADESSRELIGLPPEAGETRAITLTYRYSQDEVEYDEFRLRGGLALPLAGEDGERLGTLAIFWRRVERETTDAELARLEALAAALVPALRNAFLFEDVRARVDLDPASGLQSRSHLQDALMRECARARRYERRMTLLLLRLDLPVTTQLLATVGERLRAAVRTSDIPCHLGDGTFGIVLPESALADGEHLYRRLQFAVAGKLVNGEGRARVAAGIAELRPEDDAVSFLQRAETALERALEEQSGEAEAEAAVEPSS